MVSTSGRITTPRSSTPRAGRPVARRRTGELVLTSLTKEALPVIRYRTHDLTRLLPPTARSMRTWERISGRSDDMLIIRGVNVFPSQIEELVLQAARAEPALRARVTETARSTTSRSWSKEKKRRSPALRRRIESYIGISADVRIRTIQALHRQGEAQVIDKRPR